MALSENFPKDPFVILDPKERWFPADESLREPSAEKLLPPLVSEIRNQVDSFRKSGYEGASETSKSLLKWWFQTEHFIEGSTNGEKFNYYFAQREAIESLIYLHDVGKLENQAQLTQYDAQNQLSVQHFEETWRRYVLKLATGAGKTKVLSLALVWSYFHKLYEEDSDMATNFLLIAPNIIVLERLRVDFDGLKILHFPFCPFHFKITLFVKYFNIPGFHIYPLSNPIPPIRESVSSLSILYTIFKFTNIFSTVRIT